MAQEERLKRLKPEEKKDEIKDDEMIKPVISKSQKFEELQKKVQSMKRTHDEMEEDHAEEGE
jgi:hypothetical protein